jgi:hypothetical protein
MRSCASIEPQGRRAESEEARLILRAIVFGADQRINEHHVEGLRHQACDGPFVVAIGLSDRATVGTSELLVTIGEPFSLVANAMQRDCKWRHSTLLSSSLADGRYCDFVQYCTSRLRSPSCIAGRTLLLNWRRLRLRVEAPAVEASASPTPLPVTVQMEPADKTHKAIAPRPSSGVIEIDVGATRVRR